MFDRIPAEVFPPGEFLKDALEIRGWSQTEFAEIIGRPLRLVNEVIAGKRSVTPETATELAAALGTSAEYWLNLEAMYQLSQTSPADERIAKEAALRERFPVREMTKRGWLPQSKDYAEVEKAVFSFFDISSVDSPIQFGHAARRNHDEDISVIQWAWIFRVNKLASVLTVPKFSRELLIDALGELEFLMAGPEGVRNVPRVLADCGVRFVVVEPIPGSKIQGVCFWIKDSPVIALTLKGDFIDRFWFNLRHEIEHVLRGDGKDAVIVEEFDDADPEDINEAEVAANEAAAEFCVPQQHLANFIARHHPMYSTTSFIGFSRIMKRHPGIVAGQLQRQIDRNDLFRKYQVRVRDILVQTALTDGYGQTVPIDI